MRRYNFHTKGQLHTKERMVLLLSFCQVSLVFQIWVCANLEVCGNLGVCEGKSVWRGVCRQVSKNKLIYFDMIQGWTQKRKKIRGGQGQKEQVVNGYCIL